ncbi:T9SS type A sorting domain-containing protein [candidate division KSB1 bacterium]|nr:T9SS type A sorting domain-containing protein [candidate division KSB1 bacterium]
MRRIAVRFLFILLLFFNVLFAQQGWFWQNPSPHGNGINDIQMIDSNLAFAVGTQGTIIRTDDGGLNWTMQFTDVTKEFFGVHFFNNTTGTVVGEDGIIMRTTNGGQNWIQQESGVSVHLRSVYFETADIGIVVGDSGTVLKTGNGGNSWNRVTIQGDPTMNLYDIQIKDITTEIMIVGDDATMIRTSLGDIGFEDIIGESVYFDPLSLRGLNHVSGSTWICVGLGGAAFRSLDNGDSWSPVSLPNINGRDLYDISFGTSTHGMIVGEEGVVYLTEDGGNTWSEEQAESVRLLGLSAVDMNVAMAVGDSGTVLKSVDGGVNWYNYRFSVTSVGFTDAFIPDELNAFAVNQEGELFYTEDGGQNWFNDFTVKIISGGTRLEAVQFFNSTGILVGDDGLIIRSANGGGSWSKITGVTSSYLYDVKFLTGQIICTVGASGDIYRSVDAGVNWSPANSTNSFFDQFALDFADADSGIAVGMFGTIVRTTDQGQNWITVEKEGGGPYTTKRLYDVDFADGLTGIVVGQDGTLLRTIDAGRTWSLILSGVFTEDFLSVHFADPSTGYVVGEDGLVLRTTDAGLSWHRQISRCAEALSDIYFLDNHTGIIVGNNGTILRTNDGGLPVELVAFTADTDESGVFLWWQTASEKNNYGFDIQRRLNRPTSEWQTIGFVAGNGTTAETNFYRFQDTGISRTDKNIYYRLAQIDLDGKVTFSKILAVKRHDTLPQGFVLHPVYPNPFNAATKIEFSLAREGNITLSIYNRIGQIVDTLIDGHRDAGRYQVIWNAAPHSSGIYFCVLETPGRRQSRKMLYLR